MKSNQRNAYVLRDGIMKLLSEAEVASVCTAEAAERLTDGDEYLDLERLDQGVRRAQRTPTPMGRVLPKNAVHDDTWTKILAQLSKLDIEGEHRVGGEESQSTSPTRAAISQPLTKPCVDANDQASSSFCFSEADPVKSRGSSCLSAAMPVGETPSPPAAGGGPSHAT